MIYDVDAVRGEHEIIDDIITQNVDDLISKEDFLKEFKCVHKYKNRNVNDTRTN